MILQPKMQINFLKSLIMMDKYNLYCLLVWFARNKIKHEKFFAR